MVVVVVGAAVVVVVVVAGTQASVRVPLQPALIASVGQPEESGQVQLPVQFG